MIRMPLDISLRDCSKYYLLVLTSLNLVGGAIAAPVYDVRFAAVQGDPVGRKNLTVVGSQVVTNNDLGEVVFAGDTLIRSVVDIAGQRHLNSVILGNPQLDAMPLRGAFDPSLNDSGQVAYQGAFGSNYGIVFKNQVLVSTLDSIHGSPINWFSQVTLNNAGQVLSAANNDIAKAYYINDQAVVTSGQVIDGIEIRDLSPWPTINDSGTMAFMGQWASGRGIFTANHKIIAQGDTIDGHHLTFIDSSTALNNYGKIVFLARFDDGQYGLFSQNELLVRSGDVIDGHTITFISERAAVNDFGDIVFTALYDNGQFGIFTRERLIASVGDIIDGRELQSVGQSSNGSNMLAINNLGEIAFHAYLDGGAGSMLLARPIPEPSVAALAFGAALVVSIARGTFFLIGGERK